MDRKMPTNTNKCKTFKQNWIKLNIGVDSPAMTRIVGGYWSWWQRQSSDIVSRRKLASSNLLLSRGSLARLSSGSRQTSLPHIMFLASILFLFFLPISFMLHHITYHTSWGQSPDLIQTRIPTNIMSSFFSIARSLLNQLPFNSSFSKCHVRSWPLQYTAQYADWADRKNSIQNRLVYN